MVNNRAQRIDEYSIPEDPLLSMREAMEYIDSKGIPCKSRSTFYRLIHDFKIPYINTNPEGKHKMRVFPISGLNEFLSKAKNGESND